ncbi:agmatine deiminase family protein [Solirubrobacter sp. CPCC 204708]|uniref:Agmatine deiminase family protein n=2 Tax=Solirubrobacter deserti TaxID=2282478 RepID=A0ABT4RT54_9ACTN|nr:agmatine deiminase family protein [Solirubrobacter deserti]MDA0141744.1 agmatine deiminase family protein [Solirubrobacter deserti]
MPEYRMPPEWAPHQRTWMAWPSSGYTLGEQPDEARATWAAVARAVVEFEPVSMVVDPDATDEAARSLDPRVEVVEAPLNDAWMRDIGPTFVLDGNAPAAVDWVFNGWGGQQWAQWDKDANVARFVAEQAGVPVVSSPLVNEGGGIHVDGEGTVLVTRTVQLDPGRNPDWDQARVEAELRRTLGAERIIWLERGLTRDYDEFGTRGHVDIVATFCAPGTVLAHRQDDPEHPDHDVSRTIVELLREAGLTVVEVPAPRATHDEHGPVDYSYINHYVVNGGVILCGFGEPEADARAAAIMADAYPGRRVELVDARPLFARGGGIHCITQQQPAA